MRTDGQVFAPKNSAYVGVKAELVDLGVGRDRRSAARRHPGRRAPRRDLEMLAAPDRVGARRPAWRRGTRRAAPSTAAEKAIASAEEAYRVTDAALKAGAATTTDLLESQSALTQARLNLTRAQYELVLSDVALAHATGAVGVAGLAPM